MADLAQLERAFIAADDAGNTDDAQAFAAEIKKLRANGVASTASEKPAVARQIDAKGRTLVPDMGEPSMMEGILAKAPSLPQGAVDIMTGMTGMNRGIANFATNELVIAFFG